MIAKIKENPIKYVKLFSLLFLITNVLARLLYYLVVALVYSESITPAMLVGVITANITPILFLIYIFVFYGTNKSQVLLPITYVVSVVMGLLNMTQGVGNFVSFLFSLVGLGISVFLIIDCFSNFKRLNISKKLVIISAGVSCLSILVNFLVSLVNGYWAYGIYLSSHLISLTSLLSMIAYIIFWNFAIDKRNVSVFEYDLIELKKQFDNGNITEAEYNEKKTKLLEKF